MASTASVASAMVATDAAKIHAMEAELAEVEAGLKEMALGKPGGNMVSKSQQRLREGAVCRVLHPTKGVGTGACGGQKFLRLILN